MSQISNVIILLFDLVAFILTEIKIDFFSHFFFKSIWIIDITRVLYVIVENVLHIQTLLTF